MWVCYELFQSLGLTSSRILPDPPGYRCNLLPHRLCQSLCRTFETPTLPPNALPHTRRWPWRPGWSISGLCCDKEEANRLPTAVLCFLPQITPGRSRNSQSWTEKLEIWAGGGRQLCVAEQRTGQAGREAAESKQASRGSVLHSTANALDPETLLPSLYLPVCLRVHEYWLSAAL